MLILLPTNGNNVRTLTRDMQHAQLNSIIDGLKPMDLHLEIPKFEIEYQIDLVQFLRPLKIQEIFGAKANLSGIIGRENVRINNVIHKTRVEVNEYGTRAAAVNTAVVIPLMGSSAQRIIADQPFIFFIYHRESRNIIFEGLFVEPTLSSIPPKTVATNPNQYTVRSGPNYHPRYDYSRTNNRYQ
jgi:serine protease inhibitor